MRFSSPSQRALALVLANKEAGEALRLKLAPVVHRSQLWRFATGRRRPDHKASLAIDVATHGVVAADGWATDDERAAVEAVPGLEVPATCEHGVWLEPDGTGCPECDAVDDDPPVPEDSSPSGIQQTSPPTAEKVS